MPDLLFVHVRRLFRLHLARHDVRMKLRELAVVKVLALGRVFFFN
jgi:hypothetical protein